jgi:hypothetical protein
VIFDGVTDEQKKLLARRIPSQICEEEQWYSVFDILFPGHPRPSSPYIDGQLSEEMHIFRDFMTSQGPRIIRENLEPHVNWLNSESETDLDIFQDQILGQCLQRLFEQWERDSTSRSENTPFLSRRASTDNRLEQLGGAQGTTTLTTGQQPASSDLSRGGGALPRTDCSPRHECGHLPQEAAVLLIDSGGHAPESSAMASLPPCLGSTEATQHEGNFSEWDPEFIDLSEADLFLHLDTLGRSSSEAVP